MQIIIEPAYGGFVIKLENYPLITMKCVCITVEEVINKVKKLLAEEVIKGGK